MRDREMDGGRFDYEPWRQRREETASIPYMRVEISLANNKTK
jgi:hypothetical protein